MLNNHLKSAIAPIMGEIFYHPFNQELQAGTLPKSKFQYYVEQDVMYLTDLANAFTVMSERSQQSKPKKILHKYAQHIFMERALHLDYLNSNSTKSYSINKIPIMTDYTHHILNAAGSAPISVALMTIIPCYWIYHELGKFMQKEKTQSINPYQPWIRTYSSKKFCRNVEMLIQLEQEIDKHEAVLEIDKTNYFIASAQFELHFWDAVYQFAEE